MSLMFRVAQCTTCWVQPEGYNVLSALCTPGAGGEVVHESHRVLQQGNGRATPKAIMDEGQGREWNAVQGQDVEWVTYVSITEQ